MTDEPAGPPSVLVVDDDSSVSRALIRCLATECEVRCTVVTDALGAFDLLSARPFDLIVTDMAMVGLSGGELLRICSERWPNMRRALFTGYSDAAWVDEYRRHADAVIAKGGAIRPICKLICELASNERAGGNGGAPSPD